MSLTMVRYRVAVTRATREHRTLAVLPEHDATATRISIADTALQIANST